MENKPANMDIYLVVDQNESISSHLTIDDNIDVNTPGPSGENPGTQGEEETLWEPPPKRKKSKNPIEQLFIESDRRAYHLEQERLRQRDEELRLKALELTVREEELREKAKQREADMIMQEKWLEFMKEAMIMIVSIAEKKG